MLAAHRGYDLELVLGTNVDLLLSMPKSTGAGTTGGMRPLQLPTCCCRVFGAVLASVLGPIMIMEPLLVSDEAAIHGGDCGRNISALYRHLGGEGRATEVADPSV